MPIVALVMLEFRRLAGYLETMAEGQSYCDIYGFDPERRASRLELLDLTKQDHLFARRLQESVIKPFGEEIVEAFYSRLQHHSRFREILERGYDVRALKMTQLTYMRTLGLGFDKPSYFEERLQVGLTHARVGVPLSLYQCAYRLLQQLLIERLRATLADRDEADALADFVLKITMLDMSLAIETYHRRRMTVLENTLLELNEEERVLRRRAEVDPLTQTTSRERSFELIDQTLQAMRADQRPMCIAMADLDFFKRINDAYGHLTGDAILRDVAARMLSAVRDFDAVGRYGGEEFLLVLQNASRAVAETIAERVRERVAESPVHVNGESVSVTISLGLAVARADDRPDLLIDRADRAMYAAKQAGRNCVRSEDDVAGR